MHARTGTLAAQSARFIDRVNDRAELMALIDIAGQSVAPLWPLDSAIAVNPLSGFEDMAFERAIGEAGALLGARSSLPLAQWRALMAEGRIDPVALRKAAVATLGGIDTAFALLGPDITPYNLLLARLTELPATAAPDAPRQLDAGMAVLARWVAAFFDRKVALPLQGRERGLYACITRSLRYDPALLRLAGQDGAALIAGASDDPLELIGIAMQRADVAPDHRVAWLRRRVAALPGWAGHLRWRSEHGGIHAAAGAPSTMADLVALVALVQCATRCVDPATGPAAAGDHQPGPVAYPDAALLGHFGLAPDAAQSWSTDTQAQLAAVAGMDEGALGLVFQQAAEATYLAQIVPDLEQASYARKPRSAQPHAQLVFCIDVRSEPMRRAIEAEGAFATFGYAGFFGLPIAIDPAGTGPARNQLPVLLSPAHVVPERAVHGREAEAATMLARHAALAGAQRMLDSTKAGATGFATAEAAGPLAAIAMLARTLARASRARSGAP